MNETECSILRVVRTCAVSLEVWSEPRRGVDSPGRKGEAVVDLEPRELLEDAQMGVALVAARSDDGVSPGLLGGPARPQPTYYSVWVNLINPISLPASSSSVCCQNTSYVLVSRYRCRQSSFLFPPTPHAQSQPSPKSPPPYRVHALARKLTRQRIGGALPRRRTRTWRRAGRRGGGRRRRGRGGLA